MTVDLGIGADLSELVTEIRGMCGGFGVEIAVAWPVVAGRIGRPIIAGVGSEDQVRVLPPRVFQHAIRREADVVVLAHNHIRTTGPSVADHAVTRRLVAAGRVIGIPLLAHLVVEPDAVHELVEGVRIA